jgi:hypothetical protein
MRFPLITNMPSYALQTQVSIVYAVVVLHSFIKMHQNYEDRFDSHTVGHPDAFLDGIGDDAVNRQYHLMFIIKILAEYIVNHLFFKACAQRVEHLQLTVV